jgi:hypothetical protein
LLIADKLSNKLSTKGVEGLMTVSLEFDRFWNNVNRILQSCPRVIVTFMSTYNALSVFNYSKLINEVYNLKKTYGSSDRYWNSATFLDTSYLRWPTHQTVKVLPHQFSKNIEDLKKGEKIQMFNNNMNITLNMNSILMNTTKIKEYQILFLQNKKFMVYDYINNFLYEKRNSDFYATVKYVFTDGIAETFTSNMFKNFYTNGFLSCNTINE